MQEETEAVEREVVIISTLAEIAQREIERDFPDIRICILAARVGMDVLRHYGVRCRTIPCSLSIFNAPMVARMNAEGRLPKNRDEMISWAKSDGSYSASTGSTGAFTQNGRAFDGHLAILAYPGMDDTSDGVLIDIGLSQMSLPRRGITLEPLTATVDKGFLGGGQVCTTTLNGCLLRYRHLPDSFEWTHAADWREPKRRHFIVERTIAKIDLALRNA